MFNFVFLGIFILKFTILSQALVNSPNNSLAFNFLILIASSLSAKHPKQYFFPLRAILTFHLLFFYLDKHLLHHLYYQSESMSYKYFHLVLPTSNYLHYY
jgi:hypothetical protein